MLGGGLVHGATLRAVCDTDRARADALAGQYHVEAFYGLPDLLRVNGIDAFTVLTPSGLHARSVVELASSGRPIVVEKPMALTLDDADRMIEACDGNRAKLFVVKQNRLNKPVQALRQAIEAGRFGKLVLGTVRVRWCRRQDYYDQASWRGTWAFDGGVLANQASHHLDLLEWMMGPVDSVFGLATTALVKIEAEDTAVVSLRFRNGALGVIEATTATRPKDLEGSLSILGENGAVEIGGFAVDKLKTWQFQPQTEADARVFEESGNNPAHPAGYGHAQYYNHVVDCIQNNGQQLVDGLAGRRSLELITAIYESIETRREVALRFWPERCRLGLRSPQAS
ncbi:MAG TPA: Gfo/Idh/MocA family oxidoreductase [Verrucomicrobiae bacterium]|nr:Gfo/Idh/MocA family oxidoreductase [Verrucomicrobiae bacterium]